MLLSYASYRNKCTIKSGKNEKMFWLSILETENSVPISAHRGSTSTTSSPCLWCLIVCDWVQDFTVPMHVDLNWRALCANVCAALTCQLCCGSKVSSVTSNRHTIMKGNLLLCITNEMTVIGIVEWCYTEVAYHLSVRIMESKSPATKAMIANLKDHRHVYLKRVRWLSATQVTNGFLQLNL
jgi:hypothetical protein